ncbi:nuclear pore complex protein Nup205-like protein, partial [Dinothrombium tinctorium]
FGNRWSSFKHLQEVVHNVTFNKSCDNLYEFESLLKMYKDDFSSLLKNPPRNAVHKEVVTNAAKDGINIIQHQSQSKTVIPALMVEEALIMSEMFDLNELIALELVITGSNHEPRYPGMSRGPIAVLLYYDSKLSLMNTLKILLQSSNGRTWSLNLNRDVAKVIENVTADFGREGISQCLDQLLKYDNNVEFDLLQRNQALGPGKYKKQVYNMIKSIHQLYADIVYSYAAQKDLSLSDVNKLIDVIAKRSEIISNGCLDPISTTLLMALLYTLDVSVLQNCDESDAIVHTLPVIKQSNLVDNIAKEVASKTFAVEDLKCIIDFALGITVKTLSLFPVNGVNISEVQDDAIVEDSIEKKVFEALHKYLASNPSVHVEEFFMRRIHVLISDFIAFMPLKLKDLKDKGDEISRIIAAYIAEGIQPPSTLSRHFEKFLYFLSAFYAHDNYGLSKDIWKSVLEDGQTLPKFVSFHKFIRSLVDSFLPQMLHLPLLELLSSFAATSPLSVYNLLRSSENHQNSQFSFNQFFTIFQNYHSALRGGSKGTNVNLPVSSQLQRPFMTLTAMEIDVLCGILNLIAVIVKNDRTCSIAIAENQRFNCISTFTSLIVCAIPRKLKAAILTTLGAFAKSTASIALSIWVKMDSIFPKPQIAVTTIASTQQQRFWQSGIAIEIEDIEPRNEEYPITIAFLKALNSLLLHINCTRQLHYQMSIESCLNFVINSIFLKSNSRVYKTEGEKWTVKLYCLKVIFQVLKNFDPLSDGPIMKGAFAIMSQVLQENVLFRRLMEVIENIVSALEPDSITVSTETHQFGAVIKKCLEVLLKILNLIAEKENDFLTSVHNIPGFPIAMLMKLASLFFDINPNTGIVDRLSTIIRVLYLSSDIRIDTLKFLQHLISSEASVSQQILLQIQPFNKYHEDYFIHIFLECLESDEKKLRIETLKFIMITLEKDISAFSGFGFSHRLLGYDRSMSNLCAPGPTGQTYTCLHAILGLLEACEDASQSDERCLAMQILHLLCKDIETCDITLRFVRTSYDLITRYLDVLRRNQVSNSTNWLNENNIVELSWFWKVLAIEIKITTQSNLKSHYNAYVKQLVGEKGRKKLTELLPKKIFIHSHPTAPIWEYFDAKELWKTISECTSENGGLIDIKLLHSKLINEIRLVGPQLGVVQTGVIQGEIQKILEFATNLNSSKDNLIQKVNYFEGWRELTEILLSVKCLDIFDDDIKSRLLIEIVQELLQHASMSDTIDALLTPMSSVILLASTYIRSTKREAAIKTHLLATAKSIMNLLESSSSATLWQKHKRARVNFYGTMLHIYRILPPHLFTELKLSFRLLEKLCKDVLSGHEVTKVLALAILNETDSSWIRDVANDGTLRLIIDSLLVDEKEVKAFKFDEHCKAFYSFEAKMTLLMKIASTPSGPQILIHLGIIDVLSSLECYEIYPFLFGQSDICFKMFAGITRLLLTLCCGLNKQNLDQISPFLNVRSVVINDVLRTAVSSKNSSEAEIILNLFTAVLSQLVAYCNTQLQRTFLSLINTFNEKIEVSRSQILVNVLLGYMQLCQNNSLLPLFAPSWNIQSTFMNIGQPILGTLVSIIDNSIENMNKSSSYNIIVELSLYLLWHHLNLYFTILEISEKDRSDVEKLQLESSSVVSDIFFAKIQNNVQNNNFVDALIRRIKTIILLRS